MDTPICLIGSVELKHCGYLLFIKKGSFLTRPTRSLHGLAAPDFSLRQRTNRSLCSLQELPEEP